MKGPFVRNLLSVRRLAEGSVGTRGWEGALRKGSELPGGLKPPDRSQQGPEHLLPALSGSGKVKEGQGGAVCVIMSRHYHFLLQLLEQICKVNFPLHEDTVALNDNVLKLSLHPLSSYNITALDCSGPKCTFTRSLTSPRGLQSSWI